MRQKKKQTVWTEKKENHEKICQRVHSFLQLKTEKNMNSSGVDLGHHKEKYYRITSNWKLWFLIWKEVPSYGRKDSVCENYGKYGFLQTKSESAY